MMNCTKMFAVGGAVVAALALLPACEREIARTQETEVQRDGTVRSQETRVTETPDGIRIEEEEEITRP
jgi:hypothetical protein